MRGGRDIVDGQGRRKERKRREKERWREKTHLEAGKRSANVASVVR
jgi:hypothetical protein